MEEAALSGLGKYRSVRRAQKKFDINFNPDTIVPKKNKGNTPLLLGIPVNPDPSQKRFLYGFETRLAKTIKTLNNFIPEGDEYKCSSCSEPARTIVPAFDDSNYNYILNSPDYYCIPCADSVKNDSKYPIAIFPIAFESVFKFGPFMNQAYQVFRKATGIDLKMFEGLPKRERREYAEEFIRELAEKRKHHIPGQNPMENKQGSLF
ncbi:MAG: hypothetical protein KAS32_14640 [Candidatus Peribacteraceae bacterium]|nr:hypothetical protein [Candidatus Peribacteraceae bacterium]